LLFIDRPLIHPILDSTLSKTTAAAGREASASPATRRAPKTKDHLKEQTDEHLFDISDLEKRMGESSASPGAASKFGSLQVTFKYFANAEQMRVAILQARDVPSDKGGAASVQIRVVLLPAKKQKFKTKIKGEFQDQENEKSIVVKASPMIRQTIIIKNITN
jgi:hypothetical protein